MEVAGCLATVLTASHALRGLSNPDLEETPGLATLQGLVELLADESKRPAVVDTLVCTQGVLPALARLVEVRSYRCFMQITRCHMPSALHHKTSWMRPSSSTSPKFVSPCGSRGRH